MSDELKKQKEQIGAENDQKMSAMEGKEVGEYKKY